jgi:hypothetical protein
MTLQGQKESRGRRDKLLQVQAASQAFWEESKVFEVDAPYGEPSANFSWPLAKVALVLSFTILHLVRRRLDAAV